MSEDDNKVRLNCDAIDCRPVTIDWQETLGENLEGWLSYECSDCDGCDREVVSSTHGECAHNDIEDEIDRVDDEGETETVDNECDATIYNEGPQMSYWYPVKIRDCEDAARKIKHLPLCVVEFENGDTGLALTGGGMDLSWEICEAFIALGYHPPLHFCDLPNMGSKYRDEKTQAIIAACMESCRIAESWAVGKRERLESLAVRFDGLAKAAKEAV